MASSNLSFSTVSGLTARSVLNSFDAFSSKELKTIQPIVIGANGIGQDSGIIDVKLAKAVPSFVEPLDGIPFIRVFSDTGCEMPYTTEFVPKVRRFLQDHEIPFIVLEKNDPWGFHSRPALDLSYMTNVGKKGYNPGIPTRKYRSCTDNHKIIPMRRLLSRLTNDLWGISNAKWSFLVRRGKIAPHRFRIGISFEESHRTFFQPRLRSAVRAIINNKVNGVPFDEITPGDLRNYNERRMKSSSRFKPLSAEEIEQISDQIEKIMDDRPVANDTKYCLNEFPLVSRKICRSHCHSVLKDTPLEGMLPSGCYCCPFQPVRSYWSIMILYPQIWDRITTMEEQALAYNHKLTLISKTESITQAVLKWEKNNKCVREDPIIAARSILEETASLDRAM